MKLNLKLKERSLSKVGLLFGKELGFVRMTDIMIGKLSLPLESSIMRQLESQNKFGVVKDKSIHELVELGLPTYVGKPLLRILRLAEFNAS